MTHPTAPIKVFAVRGIEAAIWRKDTAGPARHNDLEIRVSRRYQDNQGWHRTNRFSIDELPKVSAVVEAAYRYLAIKEYEPRQYRAASDNQSINKLDQSNERA